MFLFPMHYGAQVSFLNYASYLYSTLWPVWPTAGDTFEDEEEEGHKETKQQYQETVQTMTPEMFRGVCLMGVWEIGCKVIV